MVTGILLRVESCIKECLVLCVCTHHSCCMEGDQVGGEWSSWRDLEQVSPDVRHPIQCI